MFGQPSYYGPRQYYPSGYGYSDHNPYLHSSYLQPPTRTSRYGREEDEDEERRRRLIAERRAKRAQYLPDEVDEDEEGEGDDWYAPRQLSPRERMYLEAKKRQGFLERQRREEEAQREAEKERERKWQEELEKREREDEEKRRLILEERRKELQRKRDETEKNQAQNQPRRRSPTPQPSPKREYSESDHEAASKIQRQYRIYRSLKALDDVEKQFDMLKDGFSYPSIIDFIEPGTTIEQQEHGEGGHISVKATHPPSDFTDDAMDVDGLDCKLAYTSGNYGLHQYSDGLDKLLIKLDGIESCGDQRIRRRRREIVKGIEWESRRLEWYWKEAWRRN